MIERPLIFSPDMVRALLAGRKTMTRRIVAPNYQVGDLLWVRENWQPMGYTNLDDSEYRIKYSADDVTMCGYLKPVQDEKYFNMLWKEVVKRYFPVEESGVIPNGYEFNIRPSIHMFKEMSRIWLRVRETRCERLHNITNRDAIAEGIEILDPSVVWGEDKPVYINYLDKGTATDSPIESFKSLFVKIHGEEFWNMNPFIWVTAFDVLSIEGYHKIKEEAIV